ncbi:MAG: hypothetical protein K6C13_11800 [Oscillospiraceae bacterium]|nr:hypothetical protein [Oscillospiraceae bacterium]
MIKQKSILTRFILAPILSLSLMLASVPMSTVNIYADTGNGEDEDYNKEIGDSKGGASTNKTGIQFTLIDASTGQPLSQTIAVATGSQNLPSDAMDYTDSRFGQPVILDQTGMRFDGLLPPFDANGNGNGTENKEALLANNSALAKEIVYSLYGEQGLKLLESGKVKLEAESLMWFTAKNGDVILTSALGVVAAIQNYGDSVKYVESYLLNILQQSSKYQFSDNGLVEMIKSGKLTLAEILQYATGLIELIPEELQGLIKDLLEPTPTITPTPTPPPPPPVDQCH